MAKSSDASQSSNESPNEPAPRRHFFRISLVLAILIAAATLPFVTNPFTPAGHIGYVFEEPRLFGEGGFRGTIDGPGTYGGSLRRHRVINIDVTPSSHSGTAAIPTADGPVELEWETILHPDPKRIQQLVESFGAADWYQRHAAPVILASLRNSISSDHTHAFQTEAIETEASSAIGDAFSAGELPFVLDRLTIRRLSAPGSIVAASRTPVAPPVETTTTLASLPVEEVAEPADDGATLIEVSHRREFRGMWLATISNVDWPSREGLPMERQKEELITYLDQLQAMNMNALIFQVRPSCDAFYKSDKEPWSRWLTGTQGKDPGYDPLEFAIEECRKRSIEFHAWFNPFRAKPAEKFALTDDHFCNEHPEHTIGYAGMEWMDPGEKVVRDWVVDVVLDVVERYNIDGVHLDDYFYPYPIRGAVFDDDASYQKYLKEWGQMEKNDWRRQNIDSLISRLSAGIRSSKPHVKFGVSPFGLYRPGEPHGTRGLDQFETIASNPKKWLEQGWIDYITPQLYWRETSNRSYSKLLEWWGETNSLRRHIYAGNSLISIERNRGNWPFSEFKTQLDASREALDQQSLGNIFFGLRVFRGKSGAKVQDQFAKSFYPTPALPPAMPWLSNRPPERPHKVHAHSAEIRWDAAAESTVKHWTLYSRNEENGTWSLKEILPASNTRVDATPGRYVLCSVDSLMQESIGVLVDVNKPVETAADAARADEPSTLESEEAQAKKDKG